MHIFKTKYFKLNQIKISNHLLFLKIKARKLQLLQWEFIMHLCFKNNSRFGTAAVELAVCLPFLLLMFAGIVEFYRVVKIKQIFTNAAREGARIAANGYLVNDDTTIGATVDKNAVIRTCQRALDISQLPINIVSNPSIVFNSPNDSEPHELSKNQVFSIVISMSYENQHFFNFKIFEYLLPKIIKAEVTMVCLKNKPVSIQNPSELLPKLSEQYQ